MPASSTVWAGEGRALLHQEHNKQKSGGQAKGTAWACGPWVPAAREEQPESREEACDQGWLGFHSGEGVISGSML